MFGKIMSISDELMWNYFELLTDLPKSEIESRKTAISKNEAHPKEVKLNWLNSSWINFIPLLKFRSN